MRHLSPAENLGELRKTCTPPHPPTPTPPQPSVQDFLSKRCLHKAGNSVSDPSHPLRRLFDPLPSGRRCRSIRARTTRMLNSFLPQTIRLLNNNSITLIICSNNRPGFRHFTTLAAYITLSHYTGAFCLSLRLAGRNASQRFMGK